MTHRPCHDCITNSSISLIPGLLWTPTILPIDYMLSKTDYDDAMLDSSPFYAILLTRGELVSSIRAFYGGMMLLKPGMNMAVPSLGLAGAHNHEARTCNQFW